MHTIEANIFNKNLTKLLVPSYITYAHTLNDAKSNYKVAALSETKNGDKTRTKFWTWKERSNVNSF